MRNSHKALFVAMLFGAAAAPSASYAATGETATAPPSVLAFDQKLQDSKIVVDYAHLPTAGYVAVYGTDKDGKPMGEPLGYSKIDAGEHRQLTISLNQQPKSGQRLWLNLYKDADSDPTFKPGSGDEPVWSKGELPAENMILIR